MFKSLSFGKLFGVPISFHWSFLLLLGYVAGTGYQEQGLNGVVQQLVVIGGIFASITAHEFGHVLAARFYKIKTHGINLNPLGGIAFLEKYPDRPFKRIAVALAGPAATFLLVILLGLLTVFMTDEGTVGRDILMMLWVSNGVILIFNLLPIYPLDGGQVLHGLVEAFAGRTWSDRICLYAGQFSALMLLVAALYLGSISLGLISCFIFVVTSVELGSPLIKVFKRKPKQQLLGSALVEGEPVAAWPTGRVVNGVEQTSYGIFVAFDRKDRHFAYAKHWKEFPEGELREDQKSVIRNYEQEAFNKGGYLRLLSPNEFRVLMLESL